MNTHIISQERNALHHSLIAKKNKRSHEFFIKDKIKVSYKEGEQLKSYKGILTSFSDDGIYLSPFKKRDTSVQSISLQSIVSVTRLLRKDRKASGIIMGVSSGVALLFLSVGDNSEESGYGFIFGILSLAGAFSSGVSFLSTYPLEWVNAKSVKRGWTFSIQ